MGFLDRFKSKWAQRKQAGGRPKHAVSKQEREDEAKRAAFRAVGSSGRASKDRGQKAEGSARKSGAEKRPRRQDTGLAYRWLRRPVVTEKSTRLSSQQQYVFEVSRAANKLDVKKAIKALYGVTPRRVNMMNFSGKELRYGRTTGRTNDWKKAIVSLKPGEKIDVVES